MQYQSDGTLYKAVNISGPTHNILGLSFVQGASDESDVMIEALTLNPAEGRRVSPDAVKMQVAEGVAQVNDELGSRLAVTRIQFVAGDTPSATIYRDMAYKIARRVQLRQGSYDGKDE